MGWGCKILNAHHIVLVEHNGAIFFFNRNGLTLTLFHLATGCDKEAAATIAAASHSDGEIDNAGEATCKKTKEVRICAH